MITCSFPNPCNPVLAPLGDRSLNNLRLSLGTPAIWAALDIAEYERPVEHSPQSNALTFGRGSYRYPDGVEALVEATSP
jgi:hypothetical protein